MGDDVMRTYTRPPTPVSTRRVYIVLGLSMKGMMKFSPGASTQWKRPRRSITQVSDCGTTRTPAEMMTMASTTSMAGRIRDVKSMALFYFFYCENDTVVGMDAHAVAHKETLLRVA